MRYNAGYSVISTSNMAKSLEYNKARALRLTGKSIVHIARELGVAKSTVSRWCRDILLTPAQIAILENNKLTRGYIGRMKGARMQYEQRILREKEFEGRGRDLLGRLTKRDIFMLGLGLYWGEGTKHGRDTAFTNSDPLIVKFILEWFKKVFSFDDNRFKLYILINEIHRERVKEVQRFWIKITRISSRSFGKTTLIKVKNKKTYSNFRKHYGTLKIAIKRPSEIHHLIMGMLKSLQK